MARCSEYFLFHDVDCSRSNNTTISEVISMIDHRSLRK
uniref:Uncharacterized protein n=1 Tax=Rhizophora mucronata TaxID=61149 RepID=A0A2P2K5M0_RHIMU